MAKKRTKQKSTVAVPPWTPEKTFEIVQLLQGWAKSTLDPDTKPETVFCVRLAALQIRDIAGESADVVLKRLSKLEDTGAVEFVVSGSEPREMADRRWRTSTVIEELEKITGQLWQEEFDKDDLEKLTEANEALSKAIINALDGRRYHVAQVRPKIDPEDLGL